MKPNDMERPVARDVTLLTDEQKALQKVEREEMAIAVESERR